MLIKLIASTAAWQHGEVATAFTKQGSTWQSQRHVAAASTLGCLASSPLETWAALPARCFSPEAMFPLILIFFLDDFWPLGGRAGSRLVHSSQIQTQKPSQVLKRK